MRKVRYVLWVSFLFFYYKSSVLFVLHVEAFNALSGETPPQFRIVLDFVRSLQKSWRLLYPACHMQTTQGPCFSMQTDLITAECCVRGSEPRPLESCYQCAARRYSSCFNSSPYVPSDPSRLTWQDSSFAFSICCQLGHTFCFVCLSCCFCFLKQLSSLATPTLVSTLTAWLPPHPATPSTFLSVWEQSSTSSTNNNSDLPQPCSTPANLPKASSLSSSPVLHQHFFAGLCFSSKAAALMPPARLWLVVLRLRHIVNNYRPIVFLAKTPAVLKRRRGILVDSFTEKIWALLFSSCILFWAQMWSSVPQIWSKSVENSRVWFLFTSSKQIKGSYPKIYCCSDSGFSKILAATSSEKKVKKKSTNEKPVSPSQPPSLPKTFQWLAFLQFLCNFPTLICFFPIVNNPFGFRLNWTAPKFTCNKPGLLCFSSHQSLDKLWPPVRPSRSKRLHTKQPRVSGPLKKDGGGGLQLFTNQLPPSLF